MNDASRIDGLLRPLGQGVLLGARSLGALRSRAWPKGEVWRQAYAAGNRSALLVGVTLAFVGMVLVFHAGFQARRLFGDVSPVGAAFIQLLIREFGPIIAALMVAARVGAGIAAEIGAMVVTDQVDALRMNAADPVRWIVAPRVLAVAVMNVVLAIYGCGVALLAGALTARRFFEVTAPVFFDFGFTGFGDVATALVKAAAFGLYIPIVAAWAGLRTRGGSEGVGRATTTAVVAGSLGVILLDALIGGIAFALGI